MADIRNSDNLLWGKAQKTGVYIGLKKTISPPTPSKNDFFPSPPIHQYFLLTHPFSLYFCPLYWFYPFIVNFSFIFPHSSLYLPISFLFWTANILFLMGVGGGILKTHTWHTTWFHNVAHSAKLKTTVQRHKEIPFTLIGQSWPRSLWSNFVEFFCAPKSILYFIYTLSGCDGGNRTRIIAVHTWRFSPLSYCKKLNFSATPLPVQTSNKSFFNILCSNLHKMLLCADINDGGKKKNLIFSTGWSYPTARHCFSEPIPVDVCHILHV